MDLRARALFVVRTLIVAAAAFALLVLGLSRADAVGERAPAANTGAQMQPGDGGPTIQATDLISIPYGFSLRQPLPSPGEPVTITGSGACTDGEEITITFTVTQSSTGAMATGEWNGDCTGELQTWTGEGTLASPSPNFSGGLAEGCAIAETRDGEVVTDERDWCDRVILSSEPLETVFAPAVTRP